MGKKRSKNLNSKKDAEPPTTERDILTGRYLTDKRTALKDWFETAKQSGNQKVEKLIIDPKQAVYARKGTKNGKKSS